MFAELRKVVTPTRQELLKYTAVVLGFVVVMMALVYGLDVLFVWVTTVVSMACSGEPHSSQVVIG